MATKRTYPNNSKKVDKRYKSAFSNKTLEVGMKGFLISFDRGKQRFCQINSYRLLNHFADILYGSEEKVKSSDSEDSDIESSLKNEVKDLKNSVKNKKRFKLIKTGCNNLIFIKTHGLVPGDLMRYIVKMLMECKSLKESNIPVIRDVLRVHPADSSCSARLTEIQKLAGDFLPKEFEKIKHRNPECKMEYFILCNRRFNDDITSIKVIESVYEGVLEANLLWTYNCRSKHICVIVEVIKHFCTMGVVEDYFTYKKFNIRELINAKSEPSSRQIVNKQTNPQYDKQQNEGTTKIQIEKNTDDKLIKEVGKNIIDIQKDVDANDKVELNGTAINNTDNKE